MKRLCLILLLSACKEEAPLPLPVALTEESAGHYCQMLLLEHEGPKGQVHLDGALAPLFFSQVSDTLAYLAMPEQSHAVTVTYVQDMTGATWAAPGSWIDARQAFYVTGSDATGGMGAPEMVPFATRAAAEGFALAHGGRVAVLDDIKALGEGAPLPADDADMAQRMRRLSGGEG
ncbi:nitrous oxide reductase accessory protein NosL [Donghicola mangrovi]|uniref:Copper resistance protein CopZ n=1 Tax=Donghicola mangrovi TaxID=2729614 RepID=A0A850Q8Y2_9RHOB|nr:nitrous oxide reductase accessory protein NosL [Donghicola mangrovi]NVO25374.1 copper resistance protein CopZ [Donghicola mangrovi]